MCELSSQNGGSACEEGVVKALSRCLEARRGFVDVAEGARLLARGTETRVPDAQRSL